MAAHLLKGLAATLLALEKKILVIGKQFVVSTFTSAEAIACTLPKGI